LRVVKLRSIEYPITLQVQLEREIQRVLMQEIYADLLKLLNLKPAVVKNDLSIHQLGILGEALRFGNLTYVDGMFSGPLDAQLTRALRDAGATWDKHWAVFRLPEKDLEPDLAQLISSAKDGYRNQMKMVTKYLDRIDPEEVSGKVAVNQLFENAVRRTEKSFHKNVGAITLTPTLTDEQRSQIVDDWKNRAHSAIKTLVTDQVSQLRARVSQSVEVGTRYSNLTKGIAHDYSVSRGRAKLIARQETKTLTNTYAEKRYEDAGVREYYWRCVHGTPAHPVRPMHQALGDRSKRGETFRFDDPPIVDERGARANPGFDYNCRCRAVAVVKFGGS
jgi:SPP1 gp7 family putative phage head morphogenesis protein